MDALNDRRHATSIAAALFNSPHLQNLADVGRLLL